MWCLVQDEKIMSGIKRFLHEKKIFYEQPSMLRPSTGNSWRRKLPKYKSNYPPEIESGQTRRERQHKKSAKWRLFIFTTYLGLPDNSIQNIDCGRGYRKYTIKKEGLHSTYDGESFSGESYLCKTRLWLLFSEVCEMPEEKKAMMPGVGRRQFCPDSVFFFFHEFNHSRMC